MVVSYCLQKLLKRERVLYYLYSYIDAYIALVCLKSSYTVIFFLSKVKLEPYVNCDGIHNFFYCKSGMGHVFLLNLKTTIIAIYIIETLAVPYAWFKDYVFVRERRLVVY